MSYDGFRHFADSWGLVFMGFLFVSFVGWTFRKGASAHHCNAAVIIFKDEDHG